MTEFQVVLRTVTIIFFTCAVLAVILAAADSLHSLPLADYLVKKFGDMMMLCVGAVVGFFAGHHYGTRKEREQKKLPNIRS